MSSPFVTQDHIDDFIRDGIVVIPDVFSPDEIQSYRDSLHDSMAARGVRHECMTEEEYKKLPRFGPHGQIFYPPWKLAIQVRYFIRYFRATMMIYAKGGPSIFWDRVNHLEAHFCGRSSRIRDTLCWIQSTQRVFLHR
jgi:hypothetical protein